MKKDAVRATVKWILLVAVICVLVVGMSSVTSAQIQIINLPLYSGYTLTDLGAGNTWGWSFAHAINNSGQAVGDMSEWNGTLRAFRTQPNQPISFSSADNLGVLPNDYRSYSYAINNPGVVVGDSVHNQNYIQTQAFRSNGPGAILENLHPAWGAWGVYANNSYARGINDYGWIVGYYTNGTATNPQSHSFVTFGPGWTQSIDSWYGYPAYSATYDINNLSQMVGWRSPTAYNPPRAFMYDAAANVMRLIDIGMLPGGATSAAYSINEYAQVVGESQTATTTHAFFFKDANNNGLVDAGELKDLDTVNSSYSGAKSINNGGVAAGYIGGCSFVLYCGSRAAIFSNGAVTDLNTQVNGGTGVWTLRVAEGINDNGQIVGFMEDNNTDNQARVRHAFRLDPAPIRRFTRF